MCSLLSNRPCLACELLLRLHRQWTDFNLSLRIGQRPELGGNASRDRRRFAGRLEAGEVRTIPPREGTAQPHAGFERRVVDDIDRALVVWRALAIAGEIAKISTRREHGRNAGHFGDLIRVLEAFERFDHQNQDDVVVDGLTVATWDPSPHRRVRALSSAAAPTT